MVTDEGRRHLADAVRTRRAQLGLAQDELIRHGGPGDLTVRKIERGEPVQYRERTILQLETALKWRNGVVRALLNGTSGDDPQAWVVHERAHAETAQTGRSRIVQDSVGGSDSVGSPSVTQIPPAALDPEVLLTRDAAVQALLKYAEVLAVRHSHDPAVIKARTEIMDFVQHLLSRLPTPDQITWPLPEED